MQVNAYEIYYVETNLICILLLTYILRMYSREMRQAAEAFYYKSCLIGCLVYCVTDMIAALCKGKDFTGVRAILYGVNTIYVALPLLLVGLWAKYVAIRMQGWGYRRNKLEKTMVGILVVVFFMILLTPVTNFAFYLDEQNFYHRGFGAYMIPILSWGYSIYITVKMQRLKTSMHSATGREIAKVLTVFLIFPTIASMIQVCIYGVTCTQVGFTMGFLTVFLCNQQIKISRDELTGLNNRREYERYISNLEKSDKNVLICMIDVDQFKKINDTYGHEEGDRALKFVASALRKACHQCQGSLFTARHGGDEFIIASDDADEKVQTQLVELIQKEVEDKNKTHDLPYKLSLSLGIACGKINSRQDTKKLIAKADQKMYEYKKSTARKI